MKRITSMFMATAIALACLFTFPMTAHAADSVGSWGDFLLAFENMKDTGGEIILTDNITKISGDDVELSASQPVKVTTGDYGITVAGGTLTIDGEIEIEKNTSGAPVKVYNGASLVLDGNACINVSAGATFGLIIEGGGLAILNDNAIIQGTDDITTVAIRESGGNRGKLIMNSGGCGVEGGSIGVFCAGDLEMNGGVVRVTQAGARAIYVKGDLGDTGNADISGGTVESGGSSGIALSISGDNAEATVSGGTIRSTNSHGIEVLSGGTVYVSGGEVTGRYYGINANGESLVDVSGGEVKATHSMGGAGIGLTADSTAGISGDAIVTGGSGGTACGVLVEDQNCEANISGGTISGSDGVKTAGEVNISGGRIEGTGGSGIRAESTAEVTITGGRVSGTINGIIDNGGTLNVSETAGETTRITGDSCGISSYSGSITFSGGIITATGEGGSGVYVLGGGSFENHGGTIRGTGSGSIGVLVGGDGSTLTAYGGLMEGTDNGLSIDANADNVILYNGTIQSTSQGNPHIYLEGDTPLWVYSITGLAESDIYWDIQGGPQNYAERESFTITSPSPLKVELTEGGQETVGFTVTGEKLDGSHVTLQDHLGTSGTLNNASYTVSGDEITFTPSLAGSDVLSIIDDITYNGQWTVDITVNAATPTGTVPTITTDSLPSGKVGKSYNVTLTASGGTEPYSWTASGLPEGLEIRTHGAIIGTPTTSGTSDVTVTVQDAEDGSISKVFSLTISKASSSGGGGGSSSRNPSIGRSDPPDGTAGSEYTYAFTASSGRSPYTFEVTDGALPDGLKLSGKGTLTGTPTKEGTYNYTITVTDSRGKTSSSDYKHVIKEGASSARRQINLTVNSLQAEINEQPYTLDAEPFIDVEASRTLVPLRFISEALGTEVKWNQESKQVTIKDGDREILMTIGSKDVLVDGEIVTIDCAPLLMPPGRTFVPLRFISETIGAEVEYDDKTGEIKIIK